MQEVRIQRHQCLFHAVELGKRVPQLDRTVLKNAGKARILGSVDEARLADRLQHALVRGRIRHPVVLAVL